MIELRKAGARHHEHLPKRDSWRTFDRASGYGSLEDFDEGRLAPGGVIARRLQRDVEIITYVFEGALTNEDSLGRHGILSTGEFQRVTTGGGIRQSESNASRTESAHVFEVSIGPADHSLAPGQEVRRFSAAQRRGVWCAVASPDGRRGSLRIHQDATVYSAILDRGQHVVHELRVGRCAWLHVVQGAALLGDLELTTGDGAGIDSERAVSLTAIGPTELLLIDVSHPLPNIAEVNLD